mmetsp:Transcript_1972/g.5749  ORF Transcript_1972/g.5749 Transcript_1972/m.5749 type:complete len:242 (+) Transcript_1972:94-819(+)
MPEGRKKDRGGNQHQRAKKKQKCDNYEEGECGFLVTGLTCQDALRGAKDLRLWLESETEDGGAPAGQGEPPDGGGASSVAQSLEAELALMRDGGAASKRFLSVGMVCKQVAFLRAQDKSDVPSQLARQFFGSSAARPFSSRFAERICPVDGSSRPKLDTFGALAHKVLSPFSGKTWRLEFEEFRGGWNTVSKEDALAACKEVLKEENISVTGADITVLCTVMPRFVGIAPLEIEIDDLEVS